MYGISVPELFVIGLVALLVFGPHRLPEMARRAGKLLGQFRDAATELRTGIEAEYDAALGPLKDVRAEMESMLPVAETPAETPAETAAEAPAKTPAETPAEAPADDTSDPSEPAAGT